MSPTTVPEPPTAPVFGDPHLRTDGDVLALAFAPCGSLWSVEEPGVVRHWHAAGSPLAWRGLSDLEMVWAFSPDGRTLASAGGDLSLWDPVTGDLLTVLPQAAWVSAVAFHAHGRLVATGHDDGSVRCWDMSAGRLLCELRLHGGAVSAVAFRADGGLLASAAEDRLIGLWDVAQGKHVGTLAGHTDRIPALTWHPDGRHLVSAGWDTTARVWDTHTCQPVILLNSHAAQVLAVAFSPDGSLLATADSAQDVHVWDFAARRTLHVLHQPELEARQLAFSPDGGRLACGGAGQVIRLWDPAGGRPLSGAATPAPTPTALALSPDGKRLATNGGGLALRVWDTARHTAVLHLHEKEVIYALAWSPDDVWIAGGTDSNILLWGAAVGEPHVLLEGPEEPTTALAFAPDGATLASASAHGLGVWLWRVEDGEPLLLIPDALDGCAVRSIAFDPTGRLLAAGGIDWLATGGSSGAASVWDVVDRAEVATFPGGALCVAFDPAGQRLATATVDQAVCVWDVKSQRLVLELAGHEDTVNCVAYSPDGRLLASGGDDHAVRLWDAATGAGLAVHTVASQVKALCFSPDGRHLYTGNGNTTGSQLDVAKLLNRSPDSNERSLAPVPAAAACRGLACPRNAEDNLRASPPADYNGGVRGGGSGRAVFSHTRGRQPRRRPASPGTVPTPDWVPRATTVRHQRGRARQATRRRAGLDRLHRR
jgi:WD40 repeat protein